jgi:acyl-CoA synthetase (NDP forming)
VTGDGVGIIGGSGGQSVSMTDAFGKAGLDVPPLTEGSYDRLRTFFRSIGASYRNPMDVGGMNRPQLQTIVDILVEDPHIDMVVAQITPESIRNRSNPQAEQNETLLDVLTRTKPRTHKAVAVMLVTPDPYGQGQELRELDQRFQAAGIPTFPSYDRAARALKKVVSHYGQAD